MSGSSGKVARRGLPPAGGAGPVTPAVPEVGQEKQRHHDQREEAQLEVAEEAGGLRLGVELDRLPPDRDRRGGTDRVQALGVVGGELDPGGPGGPGPSATARGRAERRWSPRNVLHRLPNVTLAYHFSSQV